MIRGVAIAAAVIAVPVLGLVGFAALAGHTGSADHALVRGTLQETASVQPDKTVAVDATWELSVYLGDTNSLTFDLADGSGNGFADGRAAESGLEQSAADGPYRYGNVRAEVRDSRGPVPVSTKLGSGPAGDRQLRITLGRPLRGVSANATPNLVSLHLRYDIAGAVADTGALTVWAYDGGSVTLTDASVEAIGAHVSCQSGRSVTVAGAGAGGSGSSDTDWSGCPLGVHEVNTHPVTGVRLVGMVS